MKLPKQFYFRVTVKQHGTVIEVEDTLNEDVVEVVRCKDCKWCESPLHCPDRDRMIDYEGFCSWGERRETDAAD